MGLRIHFTPADFARIRLATEPDPLWEALLGSHIVQSRRPPLVFEAWHARVRSKLTTTMRHLLAITPPKGYSPDFLTPADAVIDFSSGLETVLSVPRDRLREELALLSPARRDLPWTTRLAAGDSAVMRLLGRSLDAFHRLHLLPYRAQIGEHFSAERDRLAALLVNEGAERMLASLHPALRWRPPATLELTALTIDRDLYLDGRGLRIIPSFFCWRDPIVLRDPQLTPVIVHPVTHDLGWFGAPASGLVVGRPRQLAALLGRTRAAILEATASGATTGELAKILRIAPATASQHASVLREAGLITTYRRDSTARHTISELGRQLLGG